MKKTGILLGSIISVLSVTSCTINTCDPGSKVTQYRDVDSFDKIVSYSFVDIRFTSSESYDLKVSAGENMIQDIITYVNDNDELIVDVEDDEYNWSSNNATLYISTRMIERIIIDGSGDVNGSLPAVGTFDSQIKGSGDMDINLDCNNLYALVQGSGDMDIDGDANELQLEIDGSGDFKGKQLYTKRADITVNGSGDTRIYVSDELNARINGSGDIRFRGNPDVVTYENNGSGDLIEE